MSAMQLTFFVSIALGLALSIAQHSVLLWCRPLFGARKITTELLFVSSYMSGFAAGMQKMRPHRRWALPLSYLVYALCMWAAYALNWQYVLWLEIAALPLSLALEFVVYGRAYQAAVLWGQAWKAYEAYTMASTSTDELQMR